MLDADAARDTTELKYYVDSTKARLLGATRVRDVVLEDRFGTFIVECAGDIELKLRAEDLLQAERWISRIMAALNAQQQQQQQQPSQQNKPQSPPKVAGGGTSGKTSKSPSADAPLTRSATKEGFLQMPSPSRFQKWQSRYFRLRKSSLYYYESDAAAEGDFEGEIVLDGATIESSGEKRFLAVTEFRTYELQAPTKEAAEDWIAVLRGASGAATGGGASDRRARAESADNKTPEWIVRWDREPVDVHIARIQNSLDHVFGGAGGDLGKALSAVTTLIQTLEDKARECLPVQGRRNELTEAGRPARPDIFETLLRFYHLRIVNELSRYLGDQKYEALSVRDLLRFMDLITAYDSKLDEMLKGELGAEMRERLPPFGLGDNADNMADVYLAKLKVQLKTWTDRVVQAPARVETRLDGRLQTSGPTDLFNLLNEALSLARVSGVRRLQASVVSMCAVSLSDYLFAVINELVESPAKYESCSFVVAVTNDCWSVLDHLDRLEKEQNAVFAEFRVDLDPLRAKCAQHATRCLEVLAQQVRADLQPVLAKAFTKSHLESTTDIEDVVAVVVATLDDCLEDFHVALEPPFVSRFAKMALRDIGGAYLARLAAAYQFEGLAALHRREVDLVVLDRARLIACLEHRFLGIAVRRLFGAELLPWDDVIDMLQCATPAMIPAAAVTVARRDARLRLHVAATAKMCVDLVCNGAVGSNGGGTGATVVDARAADRQAKEVKSMVVLEIDERVPASPALDQDVLGLVELERHPYVIMWPLVKFPGAPTAAQIKKAKDTIRREMESQHHEFEVMAAPTPVEATEEKHAKLKELLRKQNSRQWRPPDKASALSNGDDDDDDDDDRPAGVIAAAAATKSVTPPLAEPPPKAAAAAAATAAAAIEFEPHIVLQYRDAAAPGGLAKVKPVTSLCALRRVAPTSTDLALVRWTEKDKKGTVAFRAPVTDLVRVEFWSLAAGGPSHFGPDGVVKVDPPTAPLRTANKDVEFCVWTKNGDKLHFSAASAGEADRWTQALRAAFVASYAKWGTTFKEEAENLLGMSVKELRALAKKRGIDASSAVEKADLVKLLASGAKDSGKPPEPATAAASAAKKKDDDVPVATNPFAKVSVGNAASTSGEDSFSNPFAKVERAAAAAATGAAAPSVASANKPAAVAPPAGPAAAVSTGATKPAATANPVAATSASNPFAPPPPLTSKPASTTTAVPSQATAPPAPLTAKPATVPVVATVPPAPLTAKPAAVPVVAATAAASSAPALASKMSSSAPAPAISSTAPTPPVVSKPLAAAGAAAPPATASAMLDDNERALIGVQADIARGMALLEDGQASEAKDLFAGAAERAKQLNNLPLRAKATAGLAGAYRGIDALRPASGAMFELAASLFSMATDMSDRINVLNEAADVYVMQKQFDVAIRCLERHDQLAKKSGHQPVFEQRIKNIKEMKAAAAAKRG